jgi:hypothetical protein
VRLRYTGRRESFAVRFCARGIYGEERSMARNVIIHLANEDPILADMEDLPGPNATTITFTNPRKRDRKSINWVTPGATMFIFPLSRINFIELVTSEEELGQVVKPWRE